MRNLLEEFGGVLITIILFVGIIGALWTVLGYASKGLI